MYITSASIQLVSWFPEEGEVSPWTRVLTVTIYPVFSDQMLRGATVVSSKSPSTEFLPILVFFKIAISLHGCLYLEAPSLEISTLLWNWGTNYTFYMCFVFWGTNLPSISILCLHEKCCLDPFLWHTSSHTHNRPKTKHCSHWCTMLVVGWPLIAPPPLDVPAPLYALAGCRVVSCCAIFLFAPAGCSITSHCNTFTSRCNCCHLSTWPCHPRCSPFCHPCQRNPCWR